MQSIWEQKHEWDTPLLQDIRTKWLTLVQDLQEVLEIEIPRCYFEGEKSAENTKHELHVFTDASQSAYGACAYIVSGGKSALVMARNRVVPLKRITLPKLELMAAVVGARLAKHLLENLNVGHTDVNFWSDSQIVLKWITTSKPLKTFIANRITEIKDLVNKQRWRYCPTDTNPADLLTRGMTGTKFVHNELWFHGPKWITKKIDWPTWSGNQKMLTSDEIENEADSRMMKNHTLCTSSNLEKTGVNKIVDITRYSNLKKLIRITAYVLRFIHNCKVDKPHRNSSVLTVDELQHATLLWICAAQETEFHDAI